MADDTFASRSIVQVHKKGEHLNRYQWKANSTDIKPGYVVTHLGETADTNYIDLATGGEEPLGIVLDYVRNANASNAPRNLDAASIADEAMWVQQLGSGTEYVYAFMIAGAATSKKGQKVVPAAEEGKVTSGTTAGMIVGELAEDYTQDNTDDTLVLLKV